MIKQRTVILDIDDSLCDCRQALCDILNGYAGTDIHWNTWDSFFITDKYNISDEDFFDLIITSDILSNLPIYPKTVETLTTLRDRGYNIVLVSSRNYHPDAFNVTTAWLEKNKVPYDHLHISGNGVKKSLFAKMYDNIELVLDDNVENCNDFATNCKVANIVMMDQPWNANEQRYQRITSVEQLLNII